MSRKAPAGNKPMLETERLLLRPLSRTRRTLSPHLERAERASSPVGQRTVSEATIQDLVAQSDRMLSKEKIGVFGVRMRGREDLLGFCGFVRLEGMQEAELWYELTQKVWGRGIATEASWACVRYAFEEVGMERVIAGADASNTASLRVIEKLGMSYLGNINASSPEEPYLVLYRDDFFAAIAEG